MQVGSFGNYGQTNIGQRVRNSIPQSFFKHMDMLLFAAP
jgi:hypothetical protein